VAAWASRRSIVQALMFVTGSWCSASPLTVPRF
jgi:hypothetical protein